MSGAISYSLVEKPARNYLAYPMITIRPHNPDDYAVLPDIDNPKVQSLTKSDSDCLEKLGNFLVVARANERFGASLLHRHFPVFTNELFIEEIDHEKQAITLAPRRKVMEPVCPINFCFSADPGSVEALEMVGLEYTRTSGLDRIEPVGEADAEILLGMHEILASCEKLNRFGIRLIHNPLGLEDDWALLETSDSRERVLKSVKVKSTDRSFRESVPTFFRWRLDALNYEGAPIVSQTCKTRCNVTRGCLVRPDGGHESHGSHDTSHERW
jgi:hypothetical protein